MRVMRQDDLVLLNKLAQPLPAVKALMRQRALQRYMQLCAALAVARLSEASTSEPVQLIEKYMAHYKFTQEEINAVESS